MVIVMTLIFAIGVIMAAIGGWWHWRKKNNRSSTHAILYVGSFIAGAAIPGMQASEIGADVSWSFALVSGTVLCGMIMVFCNLPSTAQRRHIRK